MSQTQHRIRRGVREVATVASPRTFAFMASDGSLAFTVTVDGTKYSTVRVGRILHHLERVLLDPVDPPLKLVAGGLSDPPAINAVRRIIRNAFDDDPYG